MPTLERMADWGIQADRAQKQRRKLAATRAALDKLFYYGELYEPYLNLDCRFEVDNTMRLFEWLTPEERRRFNFDVSRINWRHYIHVHIAGIKKYILKVERAGTLEVEEEIRELFLSLATLDHHLEFPVLYGSGRLGFASLDPTATSGEGKSGGKLCAVEMP